MSNERDPKPSPGQLVVYEIRIKGHLSREWTDWFEGMTVTLQGNGDTLLCGPVIDQAALHSLLRKVRDLGIPLVSVNRVEHSQTDASHASPIQAHQNRSKVESKMNTNTTTEMKDRKAILSTLWIFAVFNYLYADFFSMIFNSVAYQKIAAGMTEGVVLGFAVLMETAMAMILLSRILKYRANRWANIAAGVLHTVAVSWTLSGGTLPTLWYAFFATVEIACTLFVVWYAWTWPNPEGRALNMALDQGELGANV